MLHIIDIDPLKHGLLFERFLNPERDSPPDIDIDFDERRRDEVIAYAKNKYGGEYFAKVITYGTIKTKAAFKDAARVHLGQPGFQLADQFSKALPAPIAAKDIPLSGIVDPKHERYTEATEVRSLIEKDAQIGKIFDTALGLEGLIRNAGVHACAHIISREPLLDVLPLWKRDDGEIITGWDGPQCEDVGLLKIDILGLVNMTTIDDTVRMVKANHGVEIEPLDIPLDDAPTYELLGRGESLGVFQLEGGGMQSLLKRMAPTRFGDIVACVALYRPGPMDVNAHLDYADRKNGKKPVEPIHAELDKPLEDVLGETYGLIVYQEQIMAIAQQVAGYTLGQADLLRRAMGKKKKEVMDEQFARFEAGMVEREYGKEAINQLWATVLPFAGYAFNKSHAAAYGLVTYWTAYLKAHYPAEYMAALLTANAHNKDKTGVYLSECRRMGIRVLPPDVNESVVGHAAVDGRIRFGMGAIRNVGANVVESITKTREAKGRFTSFTDFLDKIEITACNKRVIESLIKAGAFDSLGLTRMSLTQHHEAAVDAVIGLKRQEAMGQFDLFGGADDTASSDDSSPLAHLQFTTDEWPRKQLLAYEREMLGLYVSAHPLDGAERLLRPYQDTSIAELVGGEREPSSNGKEEAKIAGMISGIQRRLNKNGQPWAIVTLEDFDASVEVLFFPKSYEMFSDCLIEDNAMAVKGRVNEREGEISVFAADAVPVDIAAAEHSPGSAPPFVLRADAKKITKDIVVELRNTLGSYHGDTPVHIHLGATRLELPEWPVKVCTELVSELKSVRGIVIERVSSA